ncbi:hypothetical protein V5R04_07180 [Jonesiaceae bacterium BS-20]|uniref:Uncharacterized protein n=1 Tax=Jonesiaceae bacterium BS-20 TaxID=3120821 RepID=A0AAU7E0Q8_9MICO
MLKQFDPMTDGVILAAEKINLTAGWTSFWTKINTGDFKTLMMYATWVGVALFFGAIVTYFWQKKRGNANAAAIGWTGGLGALLAAPNVLVPVMLTLFSLVVNTVVALLS